MSDTALHQDPPAASATAGRRSVFRALSRTFDAIRTPADMPETEAVEPQPAPPTEAAPLVAAAMGAEAAAVPDAGPAPGLVPAMPQAPPSAPGPDAGPAAGMAAEAVSAPPEAPPTVEPVPPVVAGSPDAAADPAPIGPSAPPFPGVSAAPDPAPVRPVPPFAGDATPVPAAKPFPSSAVLSDRPRLPAGGADVRSIIGGSCRIVGNIDSDGDVEIVGHMVGDVRARGLVLAPNALVEGNVQAESAEIHGRLKGIVVAGTVHIAGTGDVVGEVHYLRLSMADGALIEGTCRRRDTAGS